MHEDKRNYASGAKLAEMPSPPHTNYQGAMAGSGVGRQSSKTYLLEHAERLRRKANQIEALAYAVEHVSGDAEGTLYGLLTGDFLR